MSSARKVGAKAYLEGRGDEKEMKSPPIDQVAVTGFLDVQVDEEEHSRPDFVNDELGRRFHRRKCRVGRSQVACVLSWNTCAGRGATVSAVLNEKGIAHRLFAQVNTDCSLGCNARLTSNAGSTE
jgi:hypothetical protein